VIIDEKLAQEKCVTVHVLHTDNVKEHREMPLEEALPLISKVRAFLTNLILKVWVSEKLKRSSRRT